MILQVPADAPLAIRLGADALLWGHIGGAFAGLASGFVAILAPKGRRLHRLSGDVFFAAMLMMSGVGAVVAPLLGDFVSMTAGMITFYLVATAWATVMRPAGRIGAFEPAATAAAFAIAATGLAVGLVAGQMPASHNSPYQVAFVFSAFALMAGLYDWGLVRAGGLAGRRRIARHAWRMGTALFVAAGSFAGQPKAIPEAWRGSPLLAIPMALVLVLTLFWLIRARFTRAFGPPERSPAAPMLPIHLAGRVS
jgi:uncharacterized membrane protein